MARYAVAHIWTALSIAAFHASFTRAQPLCRPYTINFYAGAGSSYKVSTSTPLGCQSSQFNVSYLISRTVSNTQNCTAFFEEAKPSAYIQSPRDGAIIYNGSSCGEYLYSTVYVQTTCSSLLLPNYITISQRTATCLSTSTPPPPSLSGSSSSSYSSFSVSTGARVGIAAGIAGIVLILCIWCRAYASALQNEEESAAARPAEHLPTQAIGRPALGTVQGFPLTAAGYPVANLPQSEQHPSGNPPSLEGPPSNHLPPSGDHPSGDPEPKEQV